MMKRGYKPATPRRGTCGSCHQPMTLIVGLIVGHGVRPRWVHDDRTDHWHRAPFVYDVAVS